MLNILLTSVGRRTYLVEYFKAALKNAGLVYASNSVKTYTLLQADKYVITPNIYDVGYIDFLLSYCSKEHITVVLSCFDVDLPILAQNKDRFTLQGITLLVSSSDVIDICNDKWKTYEFLKSIGIKQATTFLSLNDVYTAIDQGIASFPFVIKPRWGMGSIGICEAYNLEELKWGYNKVKRDIFRTYLSYESSKSKEDCILIQTKIEGEEYGLDILNDLDGDYVVTIAKQKMAMRAGETDIAKIVDVTPFLDVSRMISRNLRHIANLDVDCFVNSIGEIFILEMNCRFGGQYPFSHLAGADFPRQIVYWLQGKGNDASLLSPRVGTVACKEIKPVLFYVEER